MSFLAQPQTLFAIGPSRSFGTTANLFKGYVTVTENTTDAIEITQQPVQQGANIADHAFKKPITFSIQIRFQQSVLPGFSLTQGITSPQNLAAIYQSLLNLQQSFVPVTCTTPKRTYTNMLISAIGLTTDKTTETILAVNVSFQQIITVPLVVGQISRSQLKNKGSNSPTQTVGQKQSFISGVASAVLGNSAVAQ
jgi:hypothetical protein